MNQHLAPIMNRRPLTAGRHNSRQRLPKPQTVSETPQSEQTPMRRDLIAAPRHPHITSTATIHLGDAPSSGSDTCRDTRIIPHRRGFSANANPLNAKTRERSRLIPDAPSVVRSLSLEPFSAVIAAGVAASLLALVVVVPLSRISGLAAGIATVSLLISVRVVASNWESVTRAQKSLTSIPISTTRDRALLWAVVAIFCAWIYQSTSFGRRLRASKSDEVAATSIGVNIPMQRGISFVLSAFFTGVGGALFALFLGSVGPNVFYLDTTFLIITMLVVGGVDSLTGAVAGVLSVSVLAEILRRAEGGDLVGLADIPARPGTQRVILGSLLVVILLRRSSGIVGANEISWPKRRRGRIGTGSPVTTPNAPMPVA